MEIYLLDTHCLIWFQENSPKIPESVMEIIQNPYNIILFSQVSLFEISIKLKIGNLPAFNVSVEEVYEQGLRDGFVFSAIKNNHIYSYAKVPLVDDHRDPFDRLLLATAIEESAVILSADEKIGKYTDLVKVRW